VDHEDAAKGNKLWPLQNNRYCRHNQLGPNLAQADGCPTSALTRTQMACDGADSVCILLLLLLLWPMPSNHQGPGGDRNNL
jgi:hypothetical protein